MGENFDKALDKRQLQKKLSEARHSIMVKYPFFGCLVMGLKLSFASIETAATDMKRIIWDPEFLARLSPEEVEFVMMHEVMHCVLKHCMRGKELEHELYNIACDIVVNSTILEYMGLRDFKVDGELAIHKTPSGHEGYLFTAEQVYNMLNVVASGIPGNSGGSGMSGNGSGSQQGQLGAGGVDDTGIDTILRDKNKQAQNNGGADEGSGAGQSVGGTYGGKTLDNHSIWATVLGGDKYLQEEWKNRVIEAVKGGKNYSPNSTAMRKLVEDYINEGKVDWKSILNQFIQVVYDDKDYTFSPYDRRFADSSFILPAFNEVETEKVSKLWFLVDASGSVSDEMLGLMVSEIKAAIRQFESISGSVSFFDTQVSKPIEFEDEIEFPSFGVLGGGGTSFHAIFQYMEENMAEDLPEAVIILTDGLAPYPPEDMALGVPVLWMLIDASEDAPWGVSTHIEEFS